MKRICVYCGSNSGKRADYRAAAEALGGEMVRRGIGLVYGGGRLGLMGRIADSVAGGGGEVIGVIPRLLYEKEAAHEGLSELKVVGDMHERKALMAELSDGFVALPGGLGTFEELFESLAWAKLGLHRKPCAVLNTSGYYDALADLLAHTVAEGFLGQASRDALIMDDHPGRLLQRMEQAAAAQG